MIQTASNSRQPTSQSPLLSVIVPVYRIPERYLSACAESLREQPLFNAEFFFVLDGPDSVAESLLRGIFAGDPRFILLVLPENGGVSRARNAALARIRGRWFCFLDADDTFLPGVTDDFLAALRKHPGADIFQVHSLRTSSAGIASRFCVFPSPPPPPGDAPADDSALARYVIRNVASACSKYYSATLLPRRFSEDIRHFEDLCFVWDLLRGPVSLQFSDTPFYLISSRPNSASRAPLSAERIRNGLLALHRAAAIPPPVCAGPATHRARQTILLVEALMSSLLVNLDVPLARAILPDLRDLLDVISSPPFPSFPLLLRRSLRRRLASPETLARPTRFHRFLLWSHYRLVSRAARFEPRFLTFLAIFIPPAYRRLAPLFHPLPSTPP